MALKAVSCAQGCFLPQLPVESRDLRSQESHGSGSKYFPKGKGHTSARCYALGCIPTLGGLGIPCFCQGACFI